MEQSFGVHCLGWDAVSALLFLPSHLSCPTLQLVSPLAALLPTPTLLIVLNIYTSVSLSNSAPSLPSCHTPSLPVTLPLWGTPGVQAYFLLFYSS